MKKATVISILLIVAGFVLEWLYLNSDIISFKVIFWLSGLVCIVAGFIGLWIYTVLPIFDKKANQN